MAKPSPVTVEAAGREVSISNPDKPYFPRAGHSKLDVVRYYLAVADGALRGAGGRPNVLKRYVDGAEGEPFYQKRAPESRPPWIDSIVLKFPSGREAEEVVPRDAAGLAWMVNLGCLELHPHPVRAEDLDHPDELRLDLDPVPGVTWPQIREVAGVVHEALTDLGLIGWPKTSGSRGIHINVRIAPRWGFDEVRRAALAFAREVERRAPGRATSAWWKEEREGVFLDYNQNAKDRTVASAYSVRPTPDARVSAPVTWEELAVCDPADFTLSTMPARYAKIGDPHAAIDEVVHSLESLLELAARDEAQGLGDAPWPPHYQKQPGEPRRVAPSKRRAPAGKSKKDSKSKSDASSSGEGEAETETETETETKTRTTAKSNGTGRRQPSHPLIEIGRALHTPDALAGLERWKARHPDVAKLLEPADVLVDSMRGRYRTWTRVRVNLRHVPPEQRPAAEPLDPDEDVSTA